METTMKPNGVRFGSLAAVLLAGNVWTSASIGGEETVTFSTKRDERTFTIACRPKTETTSDWVERCNQLGRAAIDAAVAEGLIAPVDGAAFGKAAQLVQATPANAHAEALSLSRDFPIVASSH
jgi:hypothetical protein